jgi:hypothetical protein
MADTFLKPQQEKFLQYYTDPKSETFSNATQSAIKAGYSQDYADNITALMPNWLLESIGDMKMLRKAEKRLNQILDLEPVNEEGGVDNSLIANQMKAINLVAKGIGKDKYSERVEQTGKNGEPISIAVETKAAIEKALDDV